MIHSEVGAAGAVDRAPRLVAVAVSAYRPSLVTRELLDDRSKLLLQDLNPLLHDHIGLEVADGFDVEVKRFRHGVVVKWCAFDGRVFKAGIPGLGPTTNIRQRTYPSL